MDNMDDSKRANVPPEAMDAGQGDERPANSGTSDQQDHTPPQVQNAYRREYFGASPQSGTDQGGASQRSSSSGSSDENRTSSAQSEQSSYGTVYPPGGGSYKSTDNTPPFTANQPSQKKQKVKKEKKPRTPGRGRKVGRFFAALALVLVCVLAGGATGGYFVYNYMNNHAKPQNQNSIITTAPSNPSAPAQNDTASDKTSANQELTTPQVVKKTSPAMVAIYSDVVVQDIFGQQKKGEAAGSGVIISKDGYIVSNNHVIAGGKNIRVTLADGKNADAKVVGADATQDIAVLKIAGDNFPFVTFGSSADLQVGEKVIAIGNPLGELQGTVTQGVISALHRNVTIEGSEMYDLIQTDTAINHGNSGGALLNPQGQLIGINVAKSDSANGNSVEGIAFAIPSDSVKETVNRFMDPNYVQPWIGISALAVPPEMMQNYGMPQGVWVQDIAKGSPAQKAGLQKRDIITEFDGKKITSVNELNVLKSKHKVGDIIEFKIDRNGKAMDMKLTLAAEPK